MTFIQMEKNSILRVVPLQEKSIEIANKVLDNEIYLIAILKPIKFDKEIDWDYKNKINSQTHSLYLHSLNCVGYLISSYEMTNDRRYMNKAYEIMNSWIEYEKKESINKMVWMEHTVSNRVRNILQFYLVAKDVVNINEQEYENLINRHLEFLYNDKNYKKNNHGVMMDMSLLCCSSVMDDKSAKIYCEKALYRLKENFYNSFSYKGTHLENSMGYHRIVKDMYKNVEKILNKINLSLGDDILIILNRANDYFKYACKPNKELPLIGDNPKIQLKNMDKIYDDFFDGEAGITYFQYENREDEEKSTWLSFICGYSSKVHKHYDDLSFTLYYGGKDIFIDSGYFGYGDTKERRYLISQSAHNTFLINEKYYLVDNKESFKKIKITDFTSNKHYSLVKGQNTSYKDTQLYRTIILFKPDIIFIYDKGDSKSEKEYSQLFNLDSKVKVRSLDEKRCMIDDNIEISQINNKFEPIFHKSDREKPRAIISEEAENITDIAQVEFKIRCKNIKILTLISLDNSKKNIKLLNFDEKKEILYVNINDIDYSICL